MATQVDFRDMMNLNVPDGNVLQIKRGDKFIWRRPFKLNYTGLVLRRGETEIGSNNPSDWSEYTSEKKYGYLEGERHWLSDYYRYNEDFSYELPQELSVQGYEFLGWIDTDYYIQIADIQKGQFRDYNLSAYFIPTDNMVTFCNYSNGGRINELPLIPGLDAETEATRKGYYSQICTLYVPWGVKIQDEILKEQCPLDVYGKNGIKLVYSEDEENPGYTVVSVDSAGTAHDVYNKNEETGKYEDMIYEYQEIIDNWIETEVLKGTTVYDKGGDGKFTFQNFDYDLESMPADNISVYAIYKKQTEEMADILDGMIPFEIIIWRNNNLTSPREFLDVPLQEGWYEITCVGHGGGGDAGRK